MNTTECANKMLVALVKRYEQSPAELFESGFGLDEWDLAAEIGIISSDKVQERRVRFRSGGLDDLPAIVGQLVESDYVKSRRFEGGLRTLVPTQKGIDHAYRLMRPRHRKAWDYIKAHHLELIIIILAIVTIVVILILA